MNTTDTRTTVQRHYDREYDAVIAAGDAMHVARAEGLRAIARETGDEDAAQAASLRDALEALQRAVVHTGDATLHGPVPASVKQADEAALSAHRLVRQRLDVLDGRIANRYSR